MFVETIVPRFAETDALGHVNNTVVPVWLEQARTPVFRLFIPDLDIKKWKLIIARIEVSFLQEILYGYEVEVKTYLEKLGNSSFHVSQDVYQRDRLCAQGLSVMVHYDYAERKSVPIPDSIRHALEEHYRTAHQQ